METLTHGQVLARFGHALSDPTRSRLLLALREAPGYPAELADLLGVSRQSLSNHLACLRGCGLVVAVPEGRRMRYELADPALAHALTDLLGVVLAVDPAACLAAGRPGLLLMTTPASPAASDEAAAAQTAGAAAPQSRLPGPGWTR